MDEEGGRTKLRHLTLRAVESGFVVGSQQSDGSFAPRAAFESFGAMIDWIAKNFAGGEG